MRDVSEDWHAKKERQDAIVTEFINGPDSEEVLKARLYGLGLRGSYLEDEVRQAVGRKITRTKNWNCDKDKCRYPKGEVRLYPIGGGGNMILCHACWAHENRYRFDRGIVSRQPENWPQLDWTKAEVYKKAGE